jgi:hypothetical protein
MNDSRRRNDHGQFAPEVQGELDANNTSAAYNPQIIENRKATLGEKLRKAIGLRGGVEQSVPERVLSAKLRLRELARQAAYDPYSGQAQPAAGDAGKDFRNAALGIGALGAGGGAAYLGWRGGQASKSVQGAADSAKAATESAKAAADEVQRAARSGRKLATRVQVLGRKAVRAVKTPFKKASGVLGRASMYASSFFEENLENLKELSVRSVELGRSSKYTEGWGPHNAARESASKDLFGSGGVSKKSSMWDVISGKSKFEEAKNKAGLARGYRAWPKQAFAGTSRKMARDQIASARKLVTQGRLRQGALIAGAGGLAAAGAATLVPSKKEFAEKEHSGLQKAGIAAGLGAAAVGASFMPAATKLWRIQAREAAKKAQSAISKSKGLKNIIKSPIDDPNRGGKIVSDYLDASQLAMNRGLHGKVIGKVLQHAKANPGGRVSKTIGGDFGVSHYARFRAGPKEALGHWDWELGESNALKGKGRGSDWLSKRQNNIARGRDSAHAEINNRMWNHGENESEAIRHVGTNSQSKDAREYFDLLAAHKAGAAKMYAKKALIAPGLIVAGGATAAASSRNKKDL